MEEKKNEITRLQDQEKSLYAGFQAALGENNKFENFLMKVLKKKIKRVKKKEVAACGVQLLGLLQGLLPARNDSEGLEVSPAETPSVPALALGVRIVTGTL